MKMVATLALAWMLAAMPATSNYALQSFGFGSGGVGNSGTANYGLDGISGEASGADSATATYIAHSGQIQTQQANTPGAPVVDNGAGLYYNKLHFVIDPQNNPSDATFAVAISSDNFATTSYVQVDGTVAASPFWQTYASWGGASGSLAIGLQPSTTYAFKVEAYDGKYTQSGFGPSASVATVSPSLTFTLSPNTITFSSLLPATVVSSPSNIAVGITTNAASGGFIYLDGRNGGLKSAAAGYVIASATADLSSASEGFGAKSVSATQTSGGPLVVQSPYNNAGNNVGLINTVIQPIYSTTNPITGGTAAAVLEAKAASSTPAANDYSEILTVIASASF